MDHVLPEAGIAAGEFQLVEREGLQPQVILDQTTQSKMALSLSHSGTWVVVTFVTGLDAQSLPSIGVDIERIQRHRSLAHARVFCSDAQQAYLASLGDDDQASEITRLWAMKEAWFKAQQTGIFNSQTRTLEFGESTATGSDLCCQRWRGDYWLALVGEFPPAASIQCYQAEATSEANLIRPTGTHESSWSFYKGNIEIVE
jgi:phosphopantetheinyl transferase (holo-ACP synthase)